MGIVGWLLVGLIAGWLARWITGAGDGGCLFTIVVGIVGAFIGGALYRLATGAETDTFDNFDLGSIFVAFLGAVILLLVLQALSGRPRR
jgi:uncharacterized membrane protein YeaQ/YmgE (transglycosylase-associated protein family)